jgi:hypothetical protein
MNLINRNLLDTINSNICSNEISSMPKWARDEKLYNCEPSIDSKLTKSKDSSKKNTKRLFWQAIVNKR